MGYAGSVSGREFIGERKRPQVVRAAAEVEAEEAAERREREAERLRRLRRRGVDVGDVGGNEEKEHEEEEEKEESVKSPRRRDRYGDEESGGSSRRRQASGASSEKVYKIKSPRKSKMGGDGDGEEYIKAKYVSSSGRGAVEEDDGEDGSSSSEEEEYKEPDINIAKPAESDTGPTTMDQEQQVQQTNFSSSSPKIWSWTAVTVFGTPPSPRVGATLTYIPEWNACVLFGGASHEDGFMNELLRFDLDSLSWSKIEIGGIGVVPKPRYEHCAVVVHRNVKQQRPMDGSEVEVPKRRLQILVFGGSSEDCLLNDVWCFDIESLQWTELITKGKAPSPRTLHTCGYVAGQVNSNGVVSSDRIYVYGGGHVGDIPTSDNAVYCLDVDSATWIQLTTSDSSPTTTPTPRLGHTLLSYDLQTLLVFGGAMEGGKALNDVWIIDISKRSWRQIVGGSDSESWPMERCAHDADVVLVSGEPVVVLFGGMVKHGQPRVFDDVWWLRIGKDNDQDSAKFEKVDVAGCLPHGSPSGRLDHAMCSLSTSTQNPRLMLFGGMDFGNVMNDVWFLELA
ncbi:hypothetical protein HDU76_008472 [Blyttiomyces sp. JEL0837]|nr:hypothetical protein HDU76_008472 [Blyttiomyces sp. JEL0837]